MLIFEVFISALIGLMAAVPLLAFIIDSDYNDSYTYHGIPFKGSKAQLKISARNTAALKAIASQYQSGNLALLELTQEDMIDMLDLAKADAIIHLPDTRWEKQCESLIPKEQAKSRLEKVEQFCDFLLTMVVPLNEQIQTIKQGPETQKAKKNLYNQKLREYEKMFLSSSLKGKQQMKSIPSKLNKKGLFQWNG
jgi:hypothetical protein